MYRYCENQIACIGLKILNFTANFKLVNIYYCVPCAKCGAFFQISSTWGVTALPAPVSYGYGEMV